MAVFALKSGLGTIGSSSDSDPILATRLWNLDFANPVGLAAGFDKHAEVPDACLDLGFGFVEIGGVTPLPQAGNPGKRVFRLVEDRAVINRYGFNSVGLAVFAARMRRRTRSPRGPVGVNLGKNKDSADAASDYEAGMTALAGLADFLVVNLSSPNTPGLRNLQARDDMRAIITRVTAARETAAAGRRPPLLVKVAPDLDANGLADVAAVAIETGLDGVIMGNTTLARAPDLRSADRAEAGGLSGKPLMAPSTRLLGDLYRLTRGKVPLIGVGGIASGADAYAKIRAGASLVQLYTALVFHGPRLIPEIKRDLAALLRRDGFGSVNEAVGADHR